MIAEFFGLVAAATVVRNATIENPRWSLDNPATYRDLLGGGSKSAAGPCVNPDSALTIAAIFQAVSLISGDVAKLPLYPYRRMEDDGREIADQHPAYFATAVRANPMKSAKRFWRDLMVHALLYPNAWAYISRRPLGVELYNLLPDRTQFETVNGQLRVVTEVAGEVVYLDPSVVLHVRGISLDARNGVDLTKAARDSWGLELAARGYESKYFKHGARKGGQLILPAAMKKETRDKVESGFRSMYESEDGPFKVAVMREGAKFEEGQTSPREGQVSELREDRKREVASFFNLPPSMLGIPGSVSYNSFEQERLAYLHGCLHHWLDGIADECDMKLLTEQELRGDTIYFAHNTRRFTAADWATTVKTHIDLRMAEIESPNEVRRALDMPLRTDPAGDAYENPNTRSRDSKPAEKDAAANAAVLGKLDAMREEIADYRGDVQASFTDTRALSEANMRLADSFVTLDTRTAAMLVKSGEQLAAIDGLRVAGAEAIAAIGGVLEATGEHEQADQLRHGEVMHGFVTNATDENRQAFAGLFVSGLTKMATLVARDGRHAASATAKYETWLADMPRFRTVFESEITPAARAYCGVCGGVPEEIVRRASTAFFDAGLLNDLAAYLESPHAAVDFGANVESCLTQFERTAPERVTAILLGEQG